MSDKNANSYPIELTAPDISPYRAGNTGIEYVHTFDSGRPGPHVMISALTHGNEICGAIAVDFLFKHGVRPPQGKLTLAFVNPEAHARWDPSNPNASRFVEEDINRVWTEDQLDGPRDTADLRRARTLRPLFHEIDYLLDLHSMGTRHEPVTLCYGLQKERDLARKVGYPAAIACGPVFAPGKRIIEYTPFNDTSNGHAALLVECGQHWEKSAGDVALDTALYFLKALDVVDADFAQQHLTVKQPPRQRMMDVTDGIAAQTDSFRFAENFIGFEHFPRAGALVATDDGREIRTPYDDCILLMPNHRARKGQRAVRFTRLVEG